MTTTITSIERRRHPNGDYYFLTTVTCISGGDQWQVQELLAAAELASYAAFRKAMLKRAGLMFYDDTYEGRGASLWAPDIQHLIGAPAKEGAA